jgi:hypothetical protein
LVEAGIAELKRQLAPLQDRPAAKRAGDEQNAGSGPAVDYSSGGKRPDLLYYNGLRSEERMIMDKTAAAIRQRRHRDRRRPRIFLS